MRWRKNVYCTGRALCARERGSAPHRVFCGWDGVFLSAMHTRLLVVVVMAATMLGAVLAGILADVLTVLESKGPIVKGAPMLLSSSEQVAKQVSVSDIIRVPHRVREVIQPLRAGRATVGAFENDRA